MAMNSNWMFRAVVTVVTLLICLWALRLLESPGFLGFRARAVSSPPPAPAAPSSYQLPAPLPPVEVAVLPFAAFDNTCYGGEPMDLSRWTGVISGAEARSYLVRIEPDQVLSVAAEPEDLDFDLSLAVFDPAGQCVAARDDRSIGHTEAVVLQDLREGVYRVVVGGYSDHCGPYRLTIRPQSAVPAQIPAVLAKTGRNGTVVRWTSFAEVGVSHFSLYRLSHWGRERIAVLRPHGSPAGFADYSFLDRGHAVDSRYELELVAGDGRSEILSVIS